MSQWIDAKGQRCPVPVVLAKKAIAAGETSFTIEVTTPPPWKICPGWPTTRASPPPSAAFPAAAMP